MNSFQQMQASIQTTREAFDAKAAAVNQHLNQSSAAMAMPDFDANTPTDALFNSLLRANLDGASTLLQATLNATAVPLEASTPPDPAGQPDQDGV